MEPEIDIPGHHRVDLTWNLRQMAATAMMALVRVAKAHSRAGFYLPPAPGSLARHQRADGGVTPVGYVDREPVRYGPAGQFFKIEMAGCHYLWCPERELLLLRRAREDAA